MSTERWVRYTVYAALLLAAGIIWGTFRNPADPDLWHRLATGKLVWEEGSVPMYDRFSYRGRGNLVEDHEWLTGVFFYPLWRAGGLDAFVWVKIAIFVGILFTLLPPRRYVGRGGEGQGVERRDCTFASALFALVLAFALLPDLVSTIRCHAFTLLFWALWLVWLEASRRTGRIPWAAVIGSSVLWINMHGGYVAGLCLLFTYAAGEWLNGRRWIPYAALASASALSTLINPYFTGMWTSTVNAIFIPHPDFASWHPTVLADFSDPGFKILLLLSIVGGIPHLMRLSWRKGGPQSQSATSGTPGDWTPVLVTAAAAVMALRQSRNGGLFSLCAAVYAWPWLCGLWRSMAGCRRNLRNRVGLRLTRLAANAGTAAASLLIFLLLYAALHPGQFELLVSDEQYAPRAIAFLETRFKGGDASGQASAPAPVPTPSPPAPRQRLMVPFNWGSYALWRLYPWALVSMDGRYELVYTIGSYMENERFFRAQNDWRALLRDTGTTLILAAAGDAIVPQLKAESGWRVAYEDKWAVVFERQP